MTQNDADQRDPETYALIGAAMEVHGQLGRGFLEQAYQEALAIELGLRKIPFLREAQLNITYRGKVLTAKYKADFICYNAVIVELKALARLSGIEEAQCINYLKASGHERCLLLNFGAPRLEYKRLIFSNSYPRPSAPSADQP